MKVEIVMYLDIIIDWLLLHSISTDDLLSSITVNMLLKSLKVISNVCIFELLLFNKVTLKGDVAKKREKNEIISFTIICYGF